MKEGGFGLIDCQVTTGHLQRMGAREIPRKVYLKELERFLQAPTIEGRWEMPAGIFKKDGGSGFTVHG